MQRVASVKEALLAVKDEDPLDVRDAEAVETELTDEKDGAWAEGKAPIGMITEFLSLLEEEEIELAINLAQKILEFEPSNLLVKNLSKALQLKLVVDQQDAARDEDEEDSTSDEEEEEESENSEEEEEEAIASDAKDVEL